MPSTLIKICGIKDPHTATIAAQYGADFIGMLFYHKSKRFIDINQAKKIAEATKAAGAIPVAVFVDTTADLIVNICDYVGINMVQLHGEQSREQHHLLPVDYARIYVQPVNDEGNIDNKDIHFLRHLNRNRDFLLFDNIHGGSGKSFDWSKFNYDGKMSWFFSGGLSVNNVSDAIKQFNPTGVDVSSGVEKIIAEKDPELINHFINRVKQQQHPANRN